MNGKDDSDSRKTSRKFWFHKRTILFVTLVVLLPWTLLAIPGDLIGGGGTSGLNVSFNQHGWPFIHMHSTHYDLYANWVNGVFVRGKPANVDTKPHAIDSFNDFFHEPGRDSKFLDYDLRLTKSHWGELGYWSNPDSWSVWDDEHHFEMRWLGLLANLLLVSVIAMIVGWRFEKRIHDGKLFKFSLLSVGVVVTLLCFALTFAVGSYRDFNSEQSYVQGLRQLESEDLLWVNVDYTDRFPRLISQLCNGGQTPWNDFQVFRKVTVGAIDIDVDDLDEGQLERVLEVLDQGDFGLVIRAFDYNERTEKHLKQLDEHKIISLEVDFDAYDWFEEQTGKSFYDLPLEEARAAIKVSLDLQLDHLEELTVELDDYFSARAQLEPFLDLSPKTRVFVADVNEEAARFILETQDSWPAESEFEWQGLEPATLEKAEKRFPGPVDEEYEGINPTGPF